MKKPLFFTVIFIALFIFACSSSQESTEDSSGNDISNNEIYVFDDAEEVPVDTAQSIENTDVRDTQEDTELTAQPDQQQLTENSSGFIVQVGAYSSRERAETFVRQNLTKIQWPMNVKFSERVNLYVVQLPAFTTREEAEQVRNFLWKTETFKDAFIVPKN